MAIDALTQLIANFMMLGWAFLVASVMLPLAFAQGYTATAPQTVVVHVQRVATML